MIKVSADGQDVTASKLLLDEKYPVWKCDIRPNPKHYGIVKATLNLLAGDVKTIFSTNHNYGYVPSFLVAWNYPDGTDVKSSNQRNTFGIGILSVLGPAIFQFDYKVDAQKFDIIVTSSSIASGIYVEFRYYIFAEDFSLATVNTFV